MEQFPAREEEEVTETEISRDGQPVVPSSGCEDPLRYEDPVMQISGTGHWFLEGWIGDHSVEFLVDSGSLVTAMSDNFYRNLVCAGAPLGALQVTARTLRSANGTSIEVMGCSRCSVSFLGLRTEFPIIICSLATGTDAIIGTDVLVSVLPHTLDIKNGLLFAQGGASLQLHRKDSALSGRVFTVGHSSIPPYSEAVLHCSVRTTGGCALPSSGLLEGLTLFAEDTGLIVGRTLVDPSGWKVPVLVSNFGQKTVVVNPFTEVGMITQVTAIQSVVDDGMRPRGVAGELPYHLQDLVDQTSGDLDGGQRRRLAEVLLEYADIFPVPGDPLTGHTDAVEHDINTDDRSPIRCAPRRMSPQKMKKEEECVTEMLTGGQIEASDSPWSSPVVLVTKKDGGTRFCVDYRQLNDATIKDAYPLPRIDDTLDMLAGKQWFSTLDLTSGYWQVSLSREARAKTAFATHSGLFQFRVMPFGLCNAPATFERLMDRVLQGLRWSRCLVYLDDIISFGGTFDGALSNLTLIFERLRSYGLQLKSSKCHLFRVSVPFLGHIVGRRGLECDPTKIEDVKLWPVPDCLKSVQQFLGFVGYYRRFIPRFADVATPLVYLTGKDVPFVGDSSCSTAFHELRAALIDAPILAFPTETGQYILDTDASNFGLGGVLSQIQNDQERVVAYCSRALRPSQRRYCTTKREMLAAVAMCIQFRSYLRGEFHISALQKEDPVCMTLHAWVVADEFPAWVEVKSMLPELRSLWHHRNNLSVDANGTLWRKRSSQSAQLQLLVPKAGRERLFLSYHASLYGGHLGRTRTLARLADRFYWSGMADDVKDWLSQCVACIKRKSPVGRHHPLGNIPTSHHWDRIAMDILDVCDPTPEGFRYILVIADYFSKWTEAFPMKNKCADTVADILVENIILRFGMPLVIHSDQGREFENGLMKSLCALLGCTKTRTAPYHPESDGMIERFNRTCLMMLSMFVNDRRDNWHELLPFIMHAYRTSVHESTGYSPFRLMMGEECSLPQDVSTAELRTQRENDVAPHPFATWVRDALEVAYDHVRSSLWKTASRRKRLYDTKAVNRKFPVGSWVLRYYPPAAQHKLGSPWIGPHQVVRQATGHTVGIQRGADKPIIFVHVDDLKLCPGPQEITWTPRVSTAKSLCASTVAFRPGSAIGDVTPDPSVDVSAWGDASDLHHDSTIVNDLDRPVDLTGHILTPFYQRELMYQDCKFQSIAHLLCYRYAIINNQKTFATGIRKWSRILVDFPIPKFKSNTKTQQWLEILADIYTYLCNTDEIIRSALVETGPRPFTLECRSPWGRDMQHPDTAPRSCLISDILVGVRVAIASDRLTTRCRWLGTKGVAVHNTRHAHR